METIFAAVLLFGGFVAVILAEGFKKMDESKKRKIPYIIVGLLILVIVVLYFQNKSKSELIQRYECEKTHSSEECNEMQLEKNQNDSEWIYP